jgi:hypothetical protein
LFNQIAETPMLRRYSSPEQLFQFVYFFGHTRHDRQVRPQKINSILSQLPVECGA